MKVCRVFYSLSNKKKLGSQTLLATELYQIQDTLKKSEGARANPFPPNEFFTLHISYEYDEYDVFMT